MCQAPTCWVGAPTVHLVATIARIQLYSMKVGDRFLPCLSDVCKYHQRPLYRPRSWSNTGRASQVLGAEVLALPHSVRAYAPGPHDALHRGEAYKRASNTRHLDQFTRQVLHKASSSELQAYEYEIQTGHEGGIRGVKVGMLLSNPVGLGETFHRVELQRALQFGP